MSPEDRAIIMAVEAHSGQTDKAGHPYITHVIRVWQACQSCDSVTQCAALLHDVVEDTDITVEQVSAGFGLDVAEAVAALTKRRGESLEEYLERVASNQVARTVKIADSTDNYSRLLQIGDDETRERLRVKYMRVFQFLNASGGTR